MAYDKIIVIHSRLDNCVRYVLNHSKTTAPGTELALETAINCCCPETAYREMKRTKRRWDKQSGIQGFHIVHSFAPGEVTPEQAQALGVELAERLVGERFEAVVATHIDHDHIHCHIVFNSVSFMDGRKYRSDFKAYFGDIRGTSNDISRENGLSVIETKGHGKHYAEWNAERTGKTTVRDLIRQDIDAAIGDAFTYQSFFAILEKRGYTVKRGPNVTHTAVRPPGGSRFIRLDSLGDDYTEAAIMERLKGVRAGQQKSPEPPHIPVVTLAHGKRCTIRRGRIDHRPGQKLHGIRALYVRYLYVMGVIGPRGQRRRPVPFNVRAEITKLEKYKRQFMLLQNYHIESEDQLSMLKDALQADIDAQTAERRALYRRKRRGEDVDSEIALITQSLRPVRWELRVCRQIKANIPHVQEQVEQYKRSQQQQTIPSKEKSKSRERRRFYGSER